MKSLNTLKTVISARLAALIPSRVTQQMQQLQLTPLQEQLMASMNVTEIRLEYSGKDRAVVQHSKWATGAKTDYLPRDLRDVPKDELIITRSAAGVIEIRAGLGYRSVCESDFEFMMRHILANTWDAIAYMRYVERTSEDTEFQVATA